MKPTAFRRHLKFLFVLFLLISSSTFLSAQEKVGAQAEWHPAKKVIMHSPGDELFLGVLHPNAALFEKPLSLQQARKEHLDYIADLQNQGVEVITVVDTLLQGTVDKNGKAIAGKDLDELQNLAKDLLVYDTSQLSEEAKAQQDDYKEMIIKSLSPSELVSIILLQPTIKLKETGTNTGFSAEYSEAPLMNLYFCRDQLLTTAKGIVVNKLNSPQRANESRVLKFVLKKLGIEPVYEVTGEGRVEGGDYFSAGDVALIGQGLRTNPEGVKQLLDNKVFGLPTVAVVKDHWLDQEEMHLDTYFNIINPQLAVMVDMRLNQPGKPVAPEMQTTVDVYELQDGEYIKTVSDKDFQEYLGELGYTVIPVSRRDQNLYGINFLTTSADTILAIDGASQEYKDAIAAHGVNAKWMEFGALTSGYGAAHCTTQVILREAEKTE